MILIAYRQLAQELHRSGGWKEFQQYRKELKKHQKNTLWINFIEQCKQSDLIPNFLRFRIPSNGCFDDKQVREFQHKLLRKEIFTAKTELSSCNERLTEKRNAMMKAVPRRLRPSIWLCTQVGISKVRRNQQLIHNKKLSALAEAQQRPLFSVKNTVFECDLDSPLPQHIVSTLSLGPKNAVLDSFNAKDVLAEVDSLLNHCKKHNVANEVVNDINVKTLNYIKKCKKQKSARNIILTKKYLKENNLLAVPFDKGIGICVMKKDAYNKKLDAILQLPQFAKVVMRKKAKHPVLKEEDRIINMLKKMKQDGSIDESLYEKIRPRGSQPPRLYGLAKIHKNEIPVRPVLSMPGSAYHRIGIQVAEWLAKVPECRINSSTKQVSDQVNTIQLADDEELVSFDVSSLYTNVPVMEAINVCADLLFKEGTVKPPVDKETFIALAKIASCNVVMATHDGLYKQVDGLAMGSPPAPHLANGWMSQFDSSIQGDAKLFTRYMDDILREIKRDEIEHKLWEINNLHINLSFTMEREVDGTIPFLDMQLRHEGKNITSTWYSKPTDTGLILNYHSLAPRRYKRSVVSGFVHRIFRACSTWKHFHASILKAKTILEHNQYPPYFYEPIIHQTLTEIIVPKDSKDQSAENNPTASTSTSTRPTPPAEVEIAKYVIMIQYRGKCTEDFARSLHHCKAPCSIIMTLRKLKTVLPSLKPPIEKSLRSGVIYQINCAVCNAAYVGQTGRHLLTRFAEHQKPSAAVRRHMDDCNFSCTMDNVDILASATRGVQQRLTIEALFIEERRPKLNTHEDFRNKTLTIKLF